jgi:hypothetical protein
LSEWSVLGFGTGDYGGSENDEETLFDSRAVEGAGYS